MATYLSLCIIIMQLQLKALQTCKSLFQKQDPSEVNVHFIHALGPEIVRLVENSGTSTGNRWGAPAEPPVIIEASQVLETLLSLTAEANSEFVMQCRNCPLCMRSMGIVYTGSCVIKCCYTLCIVLKFLTHSLTYVSEGVKNM